MKCAWKELTAIVPPVIRQEVDRRSKDTLQELRLRTGRPVELVLGTGSCWLEHSAKSEDLQFVVNTASKYSPWAYATARSGYITAPGGHRIGLCGECVMENGNVTGIKNLTSVCIRVARDFPGLTQSVRLSGSVLILGPPGSGKTTFLRDLIRRQSNISRGSVAVVDERGELFPGNSGFEPGARTDVLTGCFKPQGISLVLKTMGPAWIAVDEITAQEDCQALLQAGWCGVRLMATAHARDRQDLLSRSVYRPLAQCGLFEDLIILQPDKSWRMERMKL